ncbi:formylglycine-generating enzyme family protein [Microbulbifer sp. 2205BS26-8]|uniref:formylglycine-generating enzyme family protein n=1 Tax=Microbulbifer sp. 2205BS26-8 TaxID=3064386 RepID=UPI00273EA1A0|nr:formylglycine-generating enzyme family protein [Microbulbifer sp. 2205BS26-8]MDP5208514.1 formylglycine-generating enzyme family protein [Microbulbifer sp. 2205BS26-8]
MKNRRLIITGLLGFALLISLPTLGEADQGANQSSKSIQSEMAYIPGGRYTPLFKDSTDSPIVRPFLLDRYAVTNRRYHAFTQHNPKWSKDNIKSVFSDGNYLQHMTPLKMDTLAEAPVTNVSWFSARAYCKSVGKRLPSLAEWEYVAQASDTNRNGRNDPAYRQKILEWYSRPAGNLLPNVKDTPANYWGVHGMHGVIWELVNDFNTALVTGESRGDTQLELSLFCGAGAVSSVDPSDYAAFMRYALRSSYRANYTMRSLGFRCAIDANQH